MDLSLIKTSPLIVDQTSTAAAASLLADHMRHWCGVSVTKQELEWLVDVGGGRTNADELDGEPQTSFGPTWGTFFQECHGLDLSISDRRISLTLRHLGCCGSYTSSKNCISNAV